jgi:hypothetical protein
MHNLLKNKRFMLVIAATLALSVTACGDDTGESTGGGGDTGTEEDSGGEDMGTPDEGTEETGGEDSEEDVVLEDNCASSFDFLETAVGDGDDNEGILGDMVSTCGQGQCLNCLFNVDACGCPDDLPEDECNLGYCVIQCIKDYDGEDTDQQVIATAANDGTLDGACIGCYGDITDCVAANSCAFAPANCATDSSSCACQTCQCENDCVSDFVACSGREPYIRCDPQPESCD